MGLYKIVTKTAFSEFDYIIVGAGSAGCVLANRIGEGRDVSILVIEAGGRDLDPLIHVPLGMGIMHEIRSHDWGYDWELEDATDRRAIDAMRGKVIGGSSAINHMSHVRGNRGDYDRWARAGLRDWSYAHVLPYFRRTETWQDGANVWRGGTGPLSVVRASSRDPLLDAFFEAGAAVGLPYNEDFNGKVQDGMSRGQSTIRRGRRHTAADAFLKPALARGNVRLVTGALTTRLVVEGGRACGVEFRRRGRSHVARASREVILSAGAFNTPQILMLSGIGPAEQLREHGIDVVHDAPGIGANLQDHLGVYLAADRPVPGPFQRELRFDRMTVNMIRAVLFGTGPATVLPGGLHGYARLDSSLGVPDVQMAFRAVSSHPHLWFPGLRKPAPDRCGVRVNLLHPKSRGRVLLTSADPQAKPRLVGNFLSEEADLRTLRDAVAFGRELMAAPVLDRFRGRETAPGSKVTSAAEIDRYIRRSVATVHHPCGTCAMGAGADSVVDPELRLRGIDGLRVVDASVMPDLVSGNINACVMMIAEKASDMIRGRAPAAMAQV